MRSLQPANFDSRLPTHARTSRGLTSVKACLLSVLLVTPASAQDGGDITGPWSAALRIPAGQIAFGLEQWNEQVRLGNLAFVDLDGATRRLDEPEFKGRPLIIEVFGSWCPNCHDAAAYLAELHRDYAEEGIAIVATGRV